MATSYFLKIDGVDGESVDAKHKDTIDVESWSWGATNAGTTAGGGRGEGKLAVQDFSFLARTSRASPQLMLACATGQHIKKAVLMVRRDGGEQPDYYTVTMTDLLVSGYSVNGSAGGGVVPTDQFSLNFAKVEVAYSPQDATGKAGAPVRATVEVPRP